MDSVNPTATAPNGSEAQSAEGNKIKRERSRIDFPYADLESAIELTQTLQARAGTSCEATQLASWMNQSAVGGTFRSRLGAARLFGLVETQQGTVTITTLGRDAADELKGPATRAEAFLRAPLYKAMYEQYQGYALPPAAAIERQMEQIGVPSKQKDRARQTFIKSAQFAGYIDQQTGRFIKPANAAPPPPPQPTERKKNGNGGGGEDSGLNLHPLLMASLRMIPAADVGWPKEQRVRWFKTFAMNVSQVYDKPEQPIDLKVTVESEVSAKE